MMKLLILNLTNLTEARYFSAWMADYLHFRISELEHDMQSIPATTFYAIAEWLEGPTPVLSGDKTVIAPIMDFSNKDYGVISDHNLIIDNDAFSIVTPDNSSQPNEEFWIIQEPEDLRHAVKVSPYGIAIESHGESEVGIKDFSYFDGIFDVLQELDIR